MDLILIFKKLFGSLEMSCCISSTLDIYVMPTVVHGNVARFIPL